MKTYRRLISALALAALVGLAACVPAPPAEPKGGDGEFRILLPAEPVSLNPDIRIDDSAFVIAQNVFNKLVTLDADYRLIPDLATSWTVSDDGTVYTFQLARGVKWHDAQPFTAADVKWTLETLAREKTPAQPTAARITSIETPDAAHVIIRLKEPWAPFLPTLAWYGAFILPKHIYEGRDWAQNPANETPIGTGPFQFVEWVKGDHVTLTTNPHYFRRGPHLDKLTFLLRKDPSALAGDLLKRGAADLALARPAFDQLRALQSAGGVQVKSFAHPARYYIGFNVRRKPLDDVRVRRALNMALDRTALVDEALLGYGAIGLGLYTPAIGWAYNAQAQAPAFDPAGAEALLDAAGLTRGPTGTRVQLTLLTSDVSPFRELVQATQKQLAQVGVVVQIILLPNPDWSKRVLQERNFDLALTDGSHGPDPDNLSFRFGTNGSNNFTGFADAAFDDALAEGARVTQLAARAQSYFRAQAILAAQLPLAPLAEYAQVLIYREGVTGLPQTEGRGLVTFNDYSLVRLKH
jgi:peptide/nickel transport system substrate-binding protein